MIGRIIPIFFIIAAIGIGFFICMLLNGGTHNENTNDNENENINDLISQLNQTSKNMVIVINNLGEPIGKKLEGELVLP